MAKIPIALSEASLSSSSADSELIGRDDINQLTEYVNNFRESLARIKKVFQVDRDPTETRRVAAHERLGEVLKAMREILEKYPKIQSTELLMAAGNLIQQVKCYDYDKEEDPTIGRGPEPADTSHFIQSVDQLALAFSTRVSEYLMGDIDLSAVTSSPASGQKQAQLALNESDPNKVLSANEIDDRFLALPQGIDLALHRAKLWSKYAKDVINYIEKKAQIDAEHSRSLLKHAQTVKSQLKEESFLPFQNIYLASLDQDIENCNSCLATANLVLGHKFVEPMGAKRIEHEKTRKQIKDTWSRELKKMHESVNNLRKARALYVTRHHELEKARLSLRSSESGAEWLQDKVDKRRRAEEEAFTRAQEAEANYKMCVQEANDRAENLQRVKKELLVQVRELLCACEVTMKAVSSAYFQLSQVNATPLPVQFQTLSDAVRLYEPGTSYMEFVKSLPAPIKRLQMKFTFQPQIDRSISMDQDQSSESEESSSPGISPNSKNNFKFSSGEELEIDDQNADSGYVPGRPSVIASHAPMSRAAGSHSFRKLKTPSRCRECDSYVYFQGVECQECGLAAHKKCLETLTIQCGHVKLPRKMTTFGVPLSAHSQSKVPHIVVKCVKEIDGRGMKIKGIYRVSGVKSRVEKLCQSFESGHALVDLSSVPANVIANVLKLYLRQLPEPLLTYRLYPEFIHIAKLYPTNAMPEDEQHQLIIDLKLTVDKLPKIHYNTLAYLMDHLKRVSNSSEDNNMPPSNLGIVFGPTLLRTSKGGTSLSSLVDTVHQTRVIELLIMYVDDIFNPIDAGDDDFSNNNNENKMIENQSPKVFKSATCVTISGQKVVTSSKATSSPATGRQSLFEAKRQFFNAPYSPPDFRPTATLNVSIVSPLSQSINSSSSPKSHPKLMRTTSSSNNSPGQHNELSRSATCGMTFVQRKMF